MIHLPNVLIIWEQIPCYKWRPVVWAQVFTLRFQFFIATSDSILFLSCYFDAKLAVRVQTAVSTWQFTDSLSSSHLKIIKLLCNMKMLNADKNRKLFILSILT